MTLTKTYYLNDSTEFTLVCEIGEWIEHMDWEHSEYSDNENLLIEMYVQKHLSDIHSDFYALLQQERDDSAESWAERDCY